MHRRCYSVVYLQCYYVFFFFKQKTAYEMRISDWSSDVCSSDLRKNSNSPAQQITGAPQCAPPEFLHWTQTAAAHDAASICGRSLAAACAIGSASCRERVCQYV